MPLMGIFQILIGTFQGSGHTLSAMVIMMGRLWGIRIPVVMYMSRTSGFSPSYIWYAMIFSNLVICLIGTAIYATGRWQHKVVEESAVEDEIISEPIG
jgi:Na+-driven multidrug efflux pump